MEIDEDLSSICDSTVSNLCLECKICRPLALFSTKITFLTF
jgi:hypothetical protein